MALFSTTGCATSESIPSAGPLPVPQSGTTFRLAQPWSPTRDAAFEPTTVVLAWSPAALRIEADLTDRDVFSKATGDNQKTWELGDVFEIFLQVEGRTGFAELHVTPNGHRTDLDLPGPRGRATPESAPVPFERMLVSPIRFSATTTRTSDGWRVVAAVPPSVFRLAEFAPSQRLRVSFSRYDATTGQGPVLSTTAAHSKIDYHRPDEWTLVQLLP